MKAKQNISLLIWKISILVLGISLVEAAEPFGDLPDNTVLVEILGQKVCLSDMEPASETKKKERESKTDEKFNLWLKQTRASNLGRYFKPLWDEYVKEKGLKVTDEEVKEFNEKMISLMASNNKRIRTKRDNLVKELVAENLEDSKRAELEKRFGLYNRILERAIDPNLAYRNNNNDAAKSFILNWKIYKELYKQYKGRVVFQQAGPEPLDAFRLFWEEQQSKGKFKFYNKDAEDLFWDYYRDENHTFYYDQDEAEQMFNTPWWLKERKEDDYDTEALWGDEVNGFQIRIDGDSGRRAFYSDKIPTFKMDLLNTGDKIFHCAPLEQFCEVEVDGKWYEWAGPKVIDILSAGLGPKRVQYDFFKIKLTENWVLKGTSTPENKSQTILLSLGTHIIRVKYKAIALPELPEVEVISNPLKFKTIPPRPEKE